MTMRVDFRDQYHELCDKFKVFCFRFSVEGGGLSGGTTAAIILSIIVLVLLGGAIVFYVRRRRASKGNIMYYKDMARKPLEDDFDIQTDEMDMDKDKVVREYTDQVQT